MFGLSIGHLVILLVVVILFRSRQIPELVQSIGKTITLFRRGYRGEELKPSPPPKEKLGVREPDAVLPKRNGSMESKEPKRA